jgi:hypothetical protein
MNTHPQPTEATHGLFWIEDPGHAWLAVDTRNFPDALECGTGYGYRRGDFVYLEEDLEAPAFLENHRDLAAHDRAGHLATRRYDFDAPVRHYSANSERLDVAAFLERRRAAQQEVQA